MPAGVSEGVPPPSQPAASRPLPPSLPVDALLHIFVLLGPDRLHAASGVCTSWRAVSEIDAGELWKRLGAARFGDRLAAPDVGTTPPRRVAAPSGLILLAQPELLHVRSQFEQSFAPTELAAARGEFIGGAAPPDAHNEISLGGWWKRRYFSFGVALRHDPWAGAPVHDAGLKCSAAEASSVAHGREHVCSSPLQQLRDHARHAIPHIHWAACTQCARVVCDDCVNSGESSHRPCHRPPTPQAHLVAFHRLHSITFSPTFDAFKACFGAAFASLPCLRSIISHSRTYARSDRARRFEHVPV